MSMLETTHARCVLLGGSGLRAILSPLRPAKPAPCRLMMGAEACSSYRAWPPATEVMSLASRGSPASWTSVTSGTSTTQADL